MRLRSYINEIREHQRAVEEASKNLQDKQARLKRSIINLNTFVADQNAVNMLKDTDIPLEEQINKLGT